MKKQTRHYDNMPRRLGMLLAYMLAWAGLALGQTTQTYTADGTFTVPAGVTKVTVQAWGGGGGGGGGGALFGTSRGGGGAGGAYTRAYPVVAPGSYPITIGAGGAGGGGTSDGSPGGSSSFGALVTAAGGAPGTYVGNGNGSGGGVTTGGTFNGGAGAAGSSAGSSAGSGGGGGGAGNGGSGGDASQTTGGTGGTGTIPGGNGATGRNTNGTGASATALAGGGAGGYYGGLFGSNGGGAGFRGQVLVSYYILTSVTTSSFVCVDNAATVTINATAANLPIGTYTVTYNISPPNAQTGLTATMTVTTAGTGTFTTPALANGGNTNITVTELQSGIYTGGISANNSAVVFVSAPLATVTGQSNSTCFAADDGIIQVNASGGTAPYLFSIDNGSTYVTGDTDKHTFTGLAPGIYKARVKDANGCESPSCP